MSAEDNKFFTADGKEVFLTEEKRKHLRPHHDVMEFLEEAISKARIPDGATYFEEAIDIGRNIGVSLLIETKKIFPKEETDFSLRAGREWPVRVSLNSRGEPCNSVTLEIKFDDQLRKYFLNTAYIGFPCPDSPYHILDRTSSEYKKALEFWCSHALAYDPKIMEKPFKASWSLVLAGIKNRPYLDESRALVNNKYMRKTEFANGEYYHIFNRGVDKRKIFQDDSDFHRLWLAVNLLNDIEDNLMTQWKNYRRKRPGLDLEMFRRESGSRQNPLVAIISYCFNPNHFHFILKQVKDNGIKKFMHKIGTSYANYFNEKYDRTGALFEGRFKSIHIKNNSRLLYLSAYVSCNSEIHNIAKAPAYKWCSFFEYATGNKDGMCDKKIILEQFRSRRDYAEFMKENAQYAKQKKEEEKDFLE